MTALRIAFAYLDASRFAYARAKHGGDWWWRESMRCYAIERMLMEIA